MRKILLVVDEYTELVNLESFFKRLGFDVLSIGKDILVNDALTRFHPDLVLATTKGRAVDGVRLAVRLKKLSSPPQIVLLYPAGPPPVLSAEAQDVVDGIAEIPFNAPILIRIAAQLAGIPTQTLLEKYERLSAAQKKNFERGSSAVVEGWHPQKNPGTAATARTPRSDVYDRFLVEHPDDIDTKAVLPHEKAAEAMQKLKEAAKVDKADLDRLDEDKREFARVLFTTHPNNGSSDGSGQKS